MDTYVSTEMSYRQFKSLKRLVKYLWHDELRDYQECDADDKRDHIYHAVVDLARIVEQIETDLGSD